MRSSSLLPLCLVACLEPPEGFDFFPPEPCTATLITPSAPHLPSTSYPSGSTDECGCEWDVTDLTTMIPGTPKVWVRGPVDPQVSEAWVAWDTSAGSERNSVSDPSGDYFFTYPAHDRGTYVTTSGRYAVYLPVVDQDADGTFEAEDCAAAYETIEWEIPDDDLRMRRPPRRLPSGRMEDAIACTPGETVVAEFTLEDSPDAPTLLPLQRTGPPRFAGIDVRSVQVLDFAGATSVTVHGFPGNPLVLTPQAPVGNLGARLAWLESTRWKQSEAVPQNGTPPRVRVTGQCPTDALPPVDVAPSYVVDAAIVPYQGQQRYVLRIHPAANGGAALSVEVEGIGFAGLRVPMVPVGPDRWRVDAEDPTATLRGWVERTPNGGLLLDLEEARYFGSDLGAVRLEPRAYP